MYKLIIVDDEESMRRGLERFINWNEIGYELVACFEDGKETIDFINEHDIVVVLTDIKMADVSGLELARYIYINKPETKVVIISGHKEFDYAKKAIEFNVENYLIKPVDIDEVKRVFLELKLKLDKEMEKKKQDKLRNDEITPLLREQFFLDLMMGGFKNNYDIENRIRIIGLPPELIDVRCYLVNLFICDYDGYIENTWKYGKERLNIAMGNFFNENQSRIKYFQIWNRNDKIKFLVFPQKDCDMGSMEKLIYNQIEDIKKDVLTFFNLVIDFKIETGFRNIYELGKVVCSYSVKDNDTQKYTHGDLKKQEIQMTKLPIKSDNLKEINLHEFSKCLISNINIGNNEETISLFDSFMQKLADESLEFQRNAVIDLFALISGGIASMGVDLARVTGGRFEYQSVMNKHSKEELASWSKNIILLIIKSLASDCESSDDAIIKRALEYIRKNYTKDITLDDVADCVFLSNAYFSRYFKQKIGENFSDYLIRIRMNNAINMLRERKYKIYEVSEKTGYKSSKYFSRIFRKYTGYTPKEYMYQVLKVSEYDEQ